jgi:hypothetical protein
MKRKLDPLKEHGKKVFISYENKRAFETRTLKFKGGKYNERTYSYERDNVPSKELTDWLNKRAGPHKVLWLAEKITGGFNFYFARPDIAMMFKLAWGGL